MTDHAKEQKNLKDAACLGALLLLWVCIVVPLIAIGCNGFMGFLLGMGLMYIAPRLHKATMSLVSKVDD